MSTDNPARSSSGVLVCAKCRSPNVVAAAVYRENASGREVMCTICGHLGDYALAPISAEIAGRVFNAGAADPVDNPDGLAGDSPLAIENRSDLFGAVYRLDLDKP